MPISRFRPKIRRARFVVSPFSSGQMLDIAQELADSIKARLRRGENAYDQPAKPLSPAYAQRKLRRYGSDKRNWERTGRTLRGLRPLSASQNRVAIGFSDPVAADRAAHLQRIERAWAVSPRDRETLLRAVRRARSVRAVAA